jgi:hypothetical protein
MSVERWSTGIMHESPEDSVRLQPQYIEVEDTGAADSVTELLHNLNRVPRGVRVVNVVLNSSGNFSCYRLKTDDPWTERRINLRFRPANARVLLEVF